MILTCPSCATRFVIDPRAIGPAGRTVRCAKCQHQWHAEAPLVTVPSEIYAAPGGARPATEEPAGAPSSKNKKEKSKKESSKKEDTQEASAPRTISPRRSVALAVVAALLVMAPFFVIKIQPYFHAVHTVRAKTPPKKVPTITLEGTPTTLLRQEEGRPVLNIEGVLVNKTGELQKVPILKASALNALGHIVREWTIPLSATQLEAGQRLPFSFTTPLPDQGVEDIAFNLL